MRNYGPFDKPYGILTWTGTKERFKGLLVLLSSTIFTLLGAASIDLGQDAPNIFLKIFIYAVYIVPSFICAAGAMILGIIWIYFPECKPGLRKKITW